MAGEHTETAAPVPNGKPVDAAVERDAILAELSAQRKPAAPAKTEEPDAGDGQAETEAAAESTDDDKLEAKAEGEKDVEEADDEPKPDDELEAKADKGKDEPAVAKGLEKVQKAEKRMRAELAREKADMRAEIAREVEQLKAEWSPKIEAAQQFEKLKARADIDPAGVLEALGVKPDRFEQIARVLYTLSKGTNDPKAREAAAAMMREREQVSRLDAMEKRLEEREKQIAAREAQESATREAAAFMSSVEKAAATDASEAPLARHFLAKSPEKTRDRLAQIAMSIIDETGEAPDADDVLAEYERIRRAELDELGVDVDALLKAQPKNKTKTAEEKRPAKTLGNDLSTKTNVPRSEAKSDDDLRDETLRELAALRAAGNAG